MRFHNFQHTKSGGGITCSLEDGTCFEKAGVTISVRSGPFKPSTLAHFNEEGGFNFSLERELEGFVCGVSTIVHPKNPHIPTIHFNFRYFEVEDPKGMYVSISTSHFIKLNSGTLKEHNKP